MGQPCSVQNACAVQKGHNTFVTGTPDYEMRPPNLTRSASEAHMVIVALDYKHSTKPLTGTQDAKHMVDLARCCGIQNVTTLLEEECTKSNVNNAIFTAGRKCNSDDVFVFYFSGHGAEVKDQDGDESDGYDEAFCLLTPNGEWNEGSIMLDDTFTQILLSAVPEDAQILVMVDACHSGTIVDLEQDSWTGRKAILIAGCRDYENAADCGTGGAFTHAMLMAIETLHLNKHYSVGKLYNTTLMEYQRIFNGSQDISLHCSPGFSPNQMAWPLLPSGTYEPPLRRAKYAAYFKMQDRGVDIAEYKDVPDDLVQWAQENDIDLGTDYEDEDLENGWKPGKALLNKLGF